jgi:hypothetical protein
MVSVLKTYGTGFYYGVVGLQELHTIFTLVVYGNNNV